MTNVFVHPLGCGRQSQGRLFSHCFGRNQDFYSSFITLLKGEDLLKGADRHGQHPFIRFLGGQTLQRQVWFREKPNQTIVLMSGRKT